MGVCSEQGCRGSQEDRAFAISLFDHHDERHHHFVRGACFGVFDGHGGHEAAQFLHDTVPHVIKGRAVDIKHGGAMEVRRIIAWWWCAPALAHAHLHRAIGYNPQ